MPVSTTWRSRCRRSTPCRAAESKLRARGITPRYDGVVPASGGCRLGGALSSPIPTESGSRSTVRPAQPAWRRRWPVRRRAGSSDGPVSRGRARGAASGPGSWRTPSGSGASIHGEIPRAGPAVRGRAAVRAARRGRRAMAGSGPRCCGGRRGSSRRRRRTVCTSTRGRRPGDPLAETLAGEADVGVLLIDPATRRRMRVNGRAEPDGTAALEVHDARGVRQLSQVHPPARGPAAVRGIGPFAPGDARACAHARAGGVGRRQPTRSSSRAATRRPGRTCRIAAGRGGSSGWRRPTGC